MNEVLLDAGHDLDGIAPGTSPSRSVVVCTTPGAGGDAFAGLLLRGGCGVPAEYFDLDAVTPRLARRWKVLDLDAYVSALHHHRSTAAGVFGLMLQWRHLRALHRRVAGLTQLRAEHLVQIVATIAPAPQYVFLTAAERDRQAVAWHERQQGPGAAYEPRAITGRLARIDATERVWRQWFAATGIMPLEVRFDHAGVISPPADDVLGALGLHAAGAPATVAAPPEASAERLLLERYRADVRNGETFGLSRSDR